MIKTILLTGSGGFIGKNLKRYLTSKYKLLTPRSFELDCTDAKAVDEYFKGNSEIDFIIHCGSIGGARGVEDKDTTIQDNLLMVENLLNAKNEKCRMILFGSGAMYDKTRKICKIKENQIGDVEPKDLYGKSKMLLAKKIKDRDDVTCLNIFACYGYGEKQNRFPSYAILQNINHKPIEINKNVVFDYLFIEDLEKIVNYFIENKPSKNIINITPTESISLLELAEKVNEISDFKSDITIKDKELGNEYTGDNSRLTNEYKSIKFTSIDVGLKKLYDYISSVSCN